MSDIDLLKLAAKAAGIAPLCFDSNNNAFKLGNNRPDFCKRSWNPLTDDGDALRLAVKLSIRLTEFKDTVVKSRGVAWKDGYASCSLWEPEGTDPYAATRRAIVRAAAEIGKFMP